MFEGFVDEGGIEYVVFGFVGEGVFPVLAGGVVSAEGAFEVGFFFAKVPVAEASGGDECDVLEVLVGFVRQEVVLTCGVEGAVPEGMSIGLVEGFAGLEVRVTVEVVFEGLPSGFAVGIEEVFGFRICGKVLVKSGPIFER